MQQRNKDAGLPGNGGRFAGQRHEDADTALTARRPLTAAELDTMPHGTRLRVVGRDVDELIALKDPPVTEDLDGHRTFKIGFAAYRLSEYNFFAPTRDELVRDDLTRLAREFPGAEWFELQTRGYDPWNITADGLQLFTVYDEDDRVLFHANGWNGSEIFAIELALTNDIDTLDDLGSWSHTDKERISVPVPRITDV